MLNEHNLMHVNCVRVYNYQKEPDGNANVRREKEKERVDFIEEFMQIISKINVISFSKIVFGLPLHNFIKWKALICI